MIRINKDTLTDLEFDTVLQQVSELCITEIGRKKTLSISPFSNKIEVIEALKLTNDYLSSFYNENRIPNHGFDPISKEIKLLQIENTYLEAASLKKLVSISITVKTIVNYLKKFKEYYTNLDSFSSSIKLTNVIEESVEKILDRFGDIKNGASPELAKIRKSIIKVKSQINQSFATALHSCQKQDLLDDIQESVVDNKRVLAVKSMHRRKVKGSIMGNSRTGSIVFIEPEATARSNRELNNLEYEEYEEVIRILKETTNIIRPFRDLLIEYQDYLAAIDVIYAKAKYAQSINAILPEISDEKLLYLKDAYHPLLLLNNLEENKPTFPQTIELNHNSRIIVISGPNAGGKSITLKTIRFVA